MRPKQRIIDSANFHHFFFERQYIPEFCEKITFNDNFSTSRKSQKKDTLSSKVFVLNLFPNYLKLELNKKIYSKKLIHKPGLAVDLTEEFKNIEEYLKSQCSSNFRKVIIRAVRRLESSFDIKYKMFYGNIDKQEYRFLMNRLYTLIENRFKQRSGRNSILRNWNYYVELAYNGINQKTASLHVIYNNDLPIDISLNFHCYNIMFSSISSYDLDYAKFSLGHIDIYKQIEWSIKNKVVLFDIGHGNYDYKRRWANFTYNFETHYISNKRTLFSQLYTLYHHSKTKLIHYLILKKVNYWFHDTVDKIKRTDKTYVPKEYEIFNSNQHRFDNPNIDINSEDLFFLKKPVYDHAYKYQEHIDNLKVYQSLNDPNSYIIKGEKFENGVKFI